MNNVSQFFTSIYKWMIVAVLISAVSAWFTMISPLSVIYSNSMYFYGLIGIELAILFGVQWGIHKISSSQAFILFLVYAAVNGLTMAGFLAYFLTDNPQLVLVIFLVAASMFAFLAVLGYTTKRDMSGWATFLFAGMWGVFASSLVNMFLGSDGFSFLISAAALVVFAGLTVYDNQYYKNMFAGIKTDEEKSKASTLGALHMYINFIMIFQSLLNLTRIGDN